MPRDLDFVELVLDVLRRSFSVARRMRSPHSHFSTALEADEVMEEMRTLLRPDPGPERAREFTDRPDAVRWSRFEHATIDWKSSAADRWDRPGPGSDTPDTGWGQFGIALCALAHEAATSGAPFDEVAARVSVPRNRWWERLTGSGDPGVLVFAVVHAQDARHAVEQTELALAAGVHGVFLINHAMGVDTLLDAYGEVRAAVGTDPWVGINPLGGDPVAVTRDAVGRGFDRLYDGIWADNAGIVETEAEQPTTGTELHDLDPQLVYFGGVAFKYQRPVSDLAAAARAAAGHVDVLTTSGSGTGSAPSKEKIDALVEGAPGLPVAVASGITPENVQKVAGPAHAVLVATGISRDFHHLDGHRVRELVRAASGI